MHASVYHQFGEPSQVINVEEASLPVPDFNQVRVKTIMSPIHNHDIWTIRGTYGYKPNLPAIGGVRRWVSLMLLGRACRI